MTPATSHPFWLAGRAATGERALEVTSPWGGGTVGTAGVPTPAQIEEAVAAAVAVTDEFAATPAHARARPSTTWCGASGSAPRRSPG